MKIFALLVCLTTLPAMAATHSFLRTGVKIQNQIFSGLEISCELRLMNAYDRSLPKPRIANAEYALVDQDGRVAAYTRDRVQGNSLNMEIIHSNGGALAWMDINDNDSISFRRSRGGQVAYIGRAYSSRGPVYNRNCMGQTYYDEAEFNSCLQAAFIDSTIQEICR